MQAKDQRSKPSSAAAPSELNLALLMENHLDALGLTVDGKVVWANVRMTELTGCSREEILGREPHELFAPQDRARALRRIESIFAGRGKKELAAEYRLQKKDGSIIPVEVTTRLVSYGGEPALLSVIRDVSERVEAEQMAAEQEERLARQRRALMTLTARSPEKLQDLQAVWQEATEIASRTLEVERVSIWRFSNDGSRIVCWDLFEKTSEAHSSGQELLARDYPVYFRALRTQRVIAADDARRDPQTCEFADSYLEPFGITSMLDAPIRVGGKLIGIICHEHTGSARHWREDDQTFAASLSDWVAQGIEHSKRQEAERALRVSEEKYRGLFQNLGEGAYQSTPDGKILSANSALVRMLGYASEAELKKANVTRDLWRKGEDRIRWIAEMEREGHMRGVEVALQKTDGSAVVALLSSRAVRDEEGDVLYYEGTLTDITERKALEEKLRQVGKMEAVGQLAGGIAHDFNNLLTLVICSSEVALDELSSDDPIRRHLEMIHKAGEKAVGLTRQLLAFSRQQVLQLRVLSLNTVVAEFETLLRGTIEESIEILMTLDPELGLVKADPSQVEQVLLNLAVNARDAMPEGGKLTIETQNVVLDEVYSSQYPGMTPGPHVMLAVTDTGEGMDEETQRHIFEPFFTTKAVGEGTGLGLSTAYGIVKQSGGYISVDSEPGKGTTFKIYLPRIEEAAGRGRQEGGTAQPEGGSETT